VEKKGEGRHKLPAQGGGWLGTHQKREKEGHYINLVPSDKGKRGGGRDQSLPAKRSPKLNDWGEKERKGKATAQPGEKKKKGGKGKSNSNYVCRDKNFAKGAPCAEKKGGYQ